MKPELKRGIKYAESEYQKAGKKIRKIGGKIKKAVGDFRPGKSEGYYKSLTIREAVKKAPGNLASLRDAFKKRWNIK